MTDARVLDLRHTDCPMTFVRVRLALDAMAPGETLAVRIKDTPANAPFFEALTSLGHGVLATIPVAEGGLDVLIRHAE